MTREPYRLEFHAAASAQVPGLPAPAYTALVDTLVALLRDPWSASAPDTPGDVEYRRAVFGDRGLVTFHVNDHERVIHVYDVTWTG